MKAMSEDFYRRLCLGASIGIIITDRELNINMMNAAAGSLFGVDPETAKGQPAASLMPDYRRVTAQKLLSRTTALARSAELRIVHPLHGRKQHLAILVDPILSSDGSLEGICLWIRDQTRRMELERRLAEIERLASMGQLAGGLAHHLNNVLGGVVTAVDHGLNSHDIDKAKRALQLVSRGLANAVKMTRKLLEFSTPEMADYNLVDLTEVVIGFVEQNQERVRQAGRQIEFDIQSVPIIAVHQTKIAQILEVLLTNSEQALGERGGQIRIVLESDEDEVRIRFMDDGPGINNEIADQIFEPFFTTRGALGGGSGANLGLGLSVARRLASEIGASLTHCKDYSSEFTCFTLTFPLARSDH